MKLLLASILIVILLPSQHAFSQDRTAIEILRLCDGREPSFEPRFGPLLCGEHLQGLNDMHAFLTDQNLPTQKAAKWHCAPALQLEQVIRIYVKHAENHPESLHNTPRLFFLEAMTEAFPCSR